MCKYNKSLVRLQDDDINMRLECKRIQRRMDDNYRALRNMNVDEYSYGCVLRRELLHRSST